MLLNSFNIDSTCFNTVESGGGGGGGGRGAKGFTIAVQQNRTDVKAVCPSLKDREGLEKENLRGCQKQVRSTTSYTETLVWKKIARKQS